jgi:hypothetical protein
VEEVEGVGHFVWNITSLAWEYITTPSTTKSEEQAAAEAATLGVHGAASDGDGAAGAPAAKGERSAS